jgi:O-antigen/teichoic acid export membrane protein
MGRAIAGTDVRWALTRALVASTATVGSMILIARGLPPAEAGQYQLAEMLILTGATCVNAGHADTGLRFAAAESPALGARIGRHLLGRAAGLGLLVLLAALLAGWLDWGAVPAAWWPWMGLAAVAAGLGLVQFGLLQGFGSYRSLALAQMVVQPARILAGLAVLWAGGGLVGLLAVLVLAHLAGTLALGLALRPHLRQPAPAIEPALKGRLHRYGWQMAILILLTVVVWDRSELFFLAHYSGPVAVAFYASTFTLASFAMRLLPGVVGGLLTPRAAGLTGADRGTLAALYLDGTRYLFAVAWPIALFGSCYASSLLTVLYGQDYAAAAPALPPLLFGAGAGAVAAAEASVKFGIERPDLLLRVAYGAAVVNLLLDWWLIPAYGWLGAAWANAAAQLLAVGIGAAITVRLLETRFPWSSLLRAAASGILLVPVWWWSAQRWPGLAGMAIGAAVLLVFYLPLLVCSGFLTPIDRERWRHLWRRPAFRHVQATTRHGRRHAYRD